MLFIVIAAQKMTHDKQRAGRWQNLSLYDERISYPFNWFSADKPLTEYWILKMSVQKNKKYPGQATN